MDLQRLGNDVADPHARGERAVRVLKHDLDLAPVAHQLRPAQLRDSPRRRSGSHRRSASPAAGSASRSSSCRSPNSPISPKVSPGATAKSMPSTALTQPILRRGKRAGADRKVFLQIVAAQAMAPTYFSFASWSSEPAARASNPRPRRRSTGSSSAQCGMACGQRG